MVIRVKHKLRRVRQLGLKKIFNHLILSYKYKKLARVYCFDRWHAHSTWYNRSYKMVAVAMANSIKPESVIEIGCGLGEIISRIDSTTKIGFDTCDKVLMAASDYHDQTIRWQSGSFFEAQTFEKDLLIAINWIHNLSPEELEKNILSNKSTTKYFLLESITKNTDGFRYYHDFSFMEKFSERIDRQECGYGEPRELILFRVL